MKKRRPYSIESRAEGKYGKTSFFPLAVWLLSDGTLLNGSREGFQRDIDHAEIGEFYQKAQGVDAVFKFMRRGNVRVMCSRNGYLFQYIRPLTLDQKNVLRKAFRSARKKNIPFSLQKRTNAWSDGIDRSCQGWLRDDCA